MCIDLIQWIKIKEGYEEVNFIRNPCLGHPRAGVRSQYILETVKNCQQRENFFTVRAPEAWNKLSDSVVGARLLDAYCRGCYSSPSSHGEFHEVS